MIAAPRNDLEVFLYLCVGRVVYREHNRSLYFVDSPYLSVTEIIYKVFKGLGQKPNIQQQYMDVHSLIKAAYCITMTERERKLLMVAFNLSGIHIKML